MSSFRLRPGFSQHVLELDPEALRERIGREVQRHGSRCELLSFEGFICLRVPVEHRRFWSPRLHLSLEPHAAGGTLVRGTYGPNASMWSSFLYGYLLVGSVGLFSGILGWCQFSLGMTAWGLWIFWVMLAAAIGMYVLAQLGQKLGARQTFQLHQIYEQAVGMDVELD